MQQLRSTPESKHLLPELLAPAGSEAALHAAVDNGADAVYFGVVASGPDGPVRFNARSRAENIPVERLKTIMDFLHSRNVRGYLTLNTLLRQNEIEWVQPILRQAADSAVDAVLVQDFGLLRLMRAYCPGMKVHASTQMSLSSPRAINEAIQWGIRRVVLPRELSISAIEKMQRNLQKRRLAIELEAFIHGALCISFSGQCYASLGLGGRSANRGICAQPCRMAYTLLDGQSNKPLPHMEQGTQCLSPCDLCSFSLLPELVATGIRSLKIEGRLKTVEYVAQVTRCYREALDQLDPAKALKEKPAQTVPEQLSLTFSRGFSTGWLEGVQPRQLVPGHVMAHRGTLLGTVVEVRRDAAVVRLDNSVKRGDGVLFENQAQPERSQGGRVYEIIQRRQSVKEAQKGDKVLLTFANHSIDADYLHEGQKVRKTDDPKLRKEINQALHANKIQKRIPVFIEVQAVTGQPLILKVHSANGSPFTITGTDPLERAQKHPLTEQVLREQLGRLGNTAFQLDRLQATIQGEPMISLSALGRCRKELVEKLEQNRPKIKPVSVIDQALKTLREEDRLRAPDPSAQALTQPVFHLLLRDAALFQDENLLQELVRLGCRSFAAELRTLDEMRLAAESVQKQNADFTAVLPRILLPGESTLLKEFEQLRPNAVLVRNFEELSFFREAREKSASEIADLQIIADFSFNVINDLAFGLLLQAGADRITPGWDLASTEAENQLTRFPTEKIERIILGRIPLFTMEHCLWKANLVEKELPCKNLCQKQPLKLLDRYGAVHSVRSDVLCRNIVESSEPLERPGPFLDPGHYRIEWDSRIGDASPVETLRRILTRE